jgi:hypothetical protein
MQPLSPRQAQFVEEYLVGMVRGQFTDAERALVDVRLDAGKAFPLRKPCAS